MYDSSDFTYKGACGGIGNGPEDFQFPFFLSKADSNNGIINLYDVNAAAFKGINVKKTVSKGAKCNSVKEDACFAYRFT